MNSSKHPLQLDAVFAIATCLSVCACNSTRPAGADKRDGSASTGGVGGSGAGGSGMATGGSAADAAGELGGSAGTMSIDAPLGTGGKTAFGGTTGSSFIDGGIPGAGGKFGTGGSSGTGGGTGIDAGARATCAAPPELRCPTGQFCDYSDHCGMETDALGMCEPTGPTVGCETVYQPVCGCNGKTYGNNCERRAAGVQKYSDGTCVAGRDAAADTDRSAALGWQAATVGSKTGPGIVVMGRGWYAASTSAPWQRISSLVDDGTPSYGLTNAQLDDLFARLATIDLSALPHASAGTTNCSATLLIKTCTDCGAKSLTYASAAQLAPEMEPVWAWFDELLGSTTIVTNPRTYCAQ